MRWREYKYKSQSLLQEIMFFYQSLIKWLNMPYKNIKRSHKHSRRVSSSLLKKNSITRYYVDIYRTEEQRDARRGEDTIGFFRHCSFKSELYLGAI